MPRYVSEPPGSRARYDELVKLLAKELKADSGAPQPLILERVTNPAGERYVTVIWDKWKGVPDESRPDVVFAAYQKAEGKEYADSIALAEAMTPDEAVALGRMRYAVVPIGGDGNGLPSAAYKKAITEEARSTVFGPQAKVLRYARIEDAEEAYTRLTERLPGSRWVITQDIDSTDD
jgi:hypothetical protein